MRSMTSVMGNFSRFSLRRPAEEAEIIIQRFRQKTFFGVGAEGGAAIALAHFAAVGVQDERDVRKLWRFHAERVKERDMLGRVAQMIFAADDVGDAHVQVVDDVHKMKHRSAVGTNSRIGNQGSSSLAIAIRN